MLERSKTSLRVVRLGGLSIITNTTKKMCRKVIGIYLKPQPQQERVKEETEKKNLTFKNQTFQNLEIFGSSEVKQDLGKSA